MSRIGTTRSVHVTAAVAVMLVATQAGPLPAQDTRAAQARRTSVMTLPGLELEMRQALVENELAMRAMNTDLVRVQTELALTAAQLQGLDRVRMTEALHAADLALAELRAPGFAWPSRARSVDFTGWQAELDRLQPEARTLPQDPADSLWRAGRNHLNRGEFDQAAAAFRRIRTESRFANSGYRAEAFYWEAFALSRRQSTEELQRAHELLATMASTYPNATHVRDAQALAATIEGRLARTGEAAAAEALLARTLAEQQVRMASTPLRSSRPAQCPISENEDVQLAALSALLTMDNDRTIPVLREVMAKRDVCSAPLRRRAVLLISRSRSPDAVALLVETARNDPEPEIRQQAVLYLGNMQSDAARTELQRILREGDNVDLQARALTALAHRRDQDGTAILREYARRGGAPIELRRQAILQLTARGRDGADDSFLRELFASTPEEELRYAIILAMSRNQSAETANWLLGIAADRTQPIDVRKQALYIGGRSGAIPADRIASLYRSFDDAEMKKQVLFTLARRDDPAVLDLLMDVAQNESDVELRKSAILWLGQSDDPRAVQLLLDIVRR